MTSSRALITLVAVLLLASPVVAQTQPAPPANPMTSDAREAWTFVKNTILRAAEKMPEENYAFKPVPEVRSFGELVTHVTYAQNAMCSMVKGGERPRVQLDKATKAEIIAALKDSDALCDATFEGFTDAQAGEVVQVYGRRRARITAFFGLSFHGYEHYGNMVTYMRLKGIVPPTSEPKKK